ncbi:MAG: glycosyltransferase family 4 protein [Candidatus Tenebribacter burtonii]|jgi:glycosyltransferase involved in cell wall biosynthesis|nr:glycosyltransferase family 4 protein [Candidatus Tenebribacter burtonii]
MKKKILFLSAYNSSFVRNDRNILGKFSDANSIPIPKHKNILNMISLVLRIFIGICKNDIIYCWFAELPAYLAVFFSHLLHKKCIVVVGGYEVANVPEIEYGGMLKPKNVKKVRYILRNVDLTLAVSESNKKEIENNFSTKQLKLVYNGVNTDLFNPQGDKKSIVITIGNVTKENLQRKGLETFVKSAALFTDVEFILIGKHYDESSEYLRSIASDNVTFTGYVNDEELLRYMQEAKVYVQVSAHEGFGISLAEAMLCECIPVVTKRGALPEVAGKSALYVPFNDPAKTTKAIKEALNTDNREQFRKHILNNFSLKNREEQLRKIIESFR